MSVAGETFRHPINGATEETWAGFSWPAFFLGVFWLAHKELWVHVLIVVLVLIVTFGFAAPIIWIVYGLEGNDAHRNSLLKKGYLSEEQWSDRLETTTDSSKKLTSSHDDGEVQRLRELANLRDEGILTEDEFLSQKAKILNL